MMGSVLICGSNKNSRINKAQEMLAVHGLELDSTAPDLMVIRKEEDKKSIGIARARDIKSFLRARPFEKDIKVVLVEDAHLLTDDAQGSLLKVLEEPPVFALIILLSDKEGSLLPTVVSRCQIVTLRSGVQTEEKNRYDIGRLSYEELFDLAKDLSAKGKEESLEFLENVLREDIRLGKSIVIIEKTETAIKDLRVSNVALKFALEYLFLLHKSDSV